MGAYTIGFKLNGNLTSAQVKKKLQEAMDGESPYTRESYSKGWNTIDTCDVKNLVFSSENAANSYCSDNCDRREVIAVRYKSYDANKFEAQTEIVMLRQLLSEAKNNYEHTVHKVNNNIKNAKSKNIKCGQCESLLNRSYLKDSNCPLCEFDLKSETDKVEIQECLDAVTSLQNKIDLAKQESIDASGELSWLVFGWAID